MKQPTPIPLILSGLCAAILTLASSVPANACGGLYCSTRPVVQTRERIVFELDGSMVSAWIQLQYQGSDPSFAWIIPVPTVPQITVGSGQAMFDALEAQTKPIFIYPATESAGRANAVAQSSCAGSFGGGTLSAAAPAKPSLTAKVVPAPNVDVWATAEVGPYETVVLSAQTARDVELWLDLHGYRVMQGSSDIVQSYLDQGMKLVAVRLQQPDGANSLQPLKLTYLDMAGCATIPIRLTQIASSPTLEIVAWVFAPSRVVPHNYAAIAVDEAILTSAADYLTVMQAEVSNAMGHGFVTEFARKTSKLDAGQSSELRDLISRHSWVTRLRTSMTPGDMTLDPQLAAAVGGVASTEVSNEIHIGGSQPVAVGTGTMIALTGLGLLIKRRRR